MMALFCVSVYQTYGKRQYGDMIGLTLVMPNTRSQGRFTGAGTGESRWGSDTDASPPTVHTLPMSRARRDCPGGWVHL